MKNEIEFKFGDYAIIEQKRHGVPNEMFVHKVVGQLRSNTWVDVPVSVPATETLHGEMEDICLCICCGIDETEVRRYRVKDMRRHSPVSLVADEKRGSTITLQAVNELIRSLESAGELSIREQKFLKLAKAFKQLEAENVQIKAMNDCLSEELRGYESDGAFEGPKMHLLWWQVETPATDRIVAGIKADGVEEFAAKLRIPGDDQFFDALAKGVALAADDFSKQLREGGRQMSIATYLNTGLAILGWAYIMVKTGQWVTKNALRQWDKRRKESRRQKAVNEFYDAFELNSLEPGSTVRLATKGDLTIMMFRSEGADK